MVVYQGRIASSTNRVLLIKEKTMAKEIKKVEKVEVKEVPKEAPKKVLVDKLGQPIVGVKTEKLSDGEIEGFDVTIVA